MSVLHEEYDHRGQLVIFRCTECGVVDLSLGSLHAHVEKHRGYTRFNLQIPFTKTAMANVDELMKRTEVLRVDETSEVPLDEVTDRR
jgi:uncharacterized Zn finger protein